MLERTKFLVACAIGLFAACDIGGGGSSTPVTDPGGASGEPDVSILVPDLATPVDSSGPGVDPGVDPGEDPGSSTGEDPGVVTCGSAPSLHPSMTKGPYCPFQAEGTVSSNCALGQHCCQYGPGSGKKSVCNDAGVPCDPGINDFGVDWWCDDTGDCNGNGYCCLEGEIIVNQQCNYMAGSGATRTFCATTCAGRQQVCSSTGDCGPRTCQPFKAFVAKDLGYCL